MTQEQLKTFLEKAKSNHSLQEKLKAAADSDAVVAIAKEADFLISADELSIQSEISEVELESVAGGVERHTWNRWSNGCTGICYNPKCND